MKNTLVGSLAGDDLTIGENNVAIGYNALGSDDVGSRNVAIGWDALASQNATGGSVNNFYNTAVGANSGEQITTGYYNTFVGALAGDGTDDGINNVAVGYLALSANCGDGNTALGIEALKVAAAGDGNTALGKNAGNALTYGSSNIFVGIDAGLTGSPGGQFTTQSNRLVLGDENVVASHIQVDFTIASDQRDKTDFTPLDVGLDFVKALNPVTYKWDKRSKYIDKQDPSVDLDKVTSDGTHKEDWLDIGFKAQEVEILEKSLGYKIADKTNLTTTLSDDGKQYGIQYTKFVPILVKAVQELSTKNDALEARIKKLEAK